MAYIIRMLEGKKVVTCFSQLKHIALHVVHHQNWVPLHLKKASNNLTSYSYFLEMPTTNSKVLDISPNYNWKVRKPYRST